MSESMFEDKIWDVLIIGGGPAGFSAAVNAKARNMSTLVIESRRPVNKMRAYPEITNYLGFTRISGSDLANHFDQHFSKTGYELRRELVMKIMPQDDLLMTSTDKGLHQSRSVILGVGVSQVKTLPGEEQFLGRGVSYCVTCDGALFRGKDIVVAGYIPEGEEEANALCGFARKVTYVAAYDEVEALEPGVELVYARPTAVLGESRARALQTDAGEFHADGIFIVRKAVLTTTLLDDLKMTGGFIDVDRGMATNIPGVFAAGDCAGPPFQIAKAVGEGQVAALNAARHAHVEKAESASV